MEKKNKINKKENIKVDPRHEEHTFDDWVSAFWRDNEKLHALDVPVEEMDIRELYWIMEIPFWEDSKNNIVLTPREVVENLDKYPKHKKRLEVCDTSFPLDIMKNRKGEWLTLDGLHRLVKLIMEGEKVIKVRKIPPELLILTKRDG